MNNFVTGLTPFLCKRASASRFDPTLMCMRYYDRSLILSKPVFRNRLDFRCFFSKNNGHTIQGDCVTVFISVVLPTLLRQLFIAPFMILIDFQERRNCLVYLFAKKRMVSFLVSSKLLY